MTHSTIVRRMFPVLTTAVGLAACSNGNKANEVDEQFEGIGELDADNDGVPADEDCDDSDPSTLGAVAWYSDGDNDGFGGADSEAYLSCTRPTGASSNNLDCDDTTAATRPDAPEICDGRDNNCDGLVDDDDPSVTGRRAAYADNDLDGFGDANNPVEVCEVGAGAELEAGDCDDSREDVNPEAEEICQNGIDDDCDGMADACSWNSVASLDDVANTWTAVEGDFAGASLGRADDATGDGLPDLLIGMPYSDLHTYDGGAVAVLSGPSAVGGGRLAGGQVDALLLGVDQSGYSGTATAAADFDGDGYSDVVTGAPEASAAVGAAGSVALFAGPVEGVIRASDADASIVGSRTGDRAGRSLSALTDITGDGVVDLVIGSGASSANAAPVAAWIISAPQDGADLSTAPALEIDPQDRPRRHIVTSADLDGDGIGDLVVGSPDTGDVDSPDGAVYIHIGPITAGRHLVDEADATWTGGAGHAAGSAVLAGHDFDGDGSLDMVIGAPGAGSDRGEVTVLTASLDGGPLSEQPHRFSGTPSSSAGAALTTATVDGSLALFVGAPNADTAELDGGAIWVVPGSASGAASLESVSVARFDGSRTSIAGESAGTSILGVGDLDNDSYDDIAVGAPLNGEGGVASGAVYLLRGQGM